MKRPAAKDSASALKRRSELLILILTRSPCYSCLAYIFCLLCEFRKMEAIIHKCHWYVDGLLMDEQQRQEVVRTPGADSKQTVSYSHLRAFRCQTRPRLGRIIASGGIRAALDADYQ